jgi:hypothetical protein
LQALIALQHAPPGDRLLKHVLGPDYLEKYKSRILYGSDYPNLIMPREDEIENLLKMNLSQEFYDNIFYNNGTALISSLTGKKEN